MMRWAPTSEFCHRLIIITYGIEIAKNRNHNINDESQKGRCLRLSYELL